MDKKGGVGIVILVIVIIIGLGVGSYFLFFNKSEPTCTDSDDGKNYTIKGTAFGIKLGTIDEEVIYEDVCLEDNADGDNLQESFCVIDEDKKEKVSFEFYNCLKGCKDGVCRESEKVSCSDSDGGKDYSIKGNMVDDIHGNYPSDYCIDSASVEDAEMYGGSEVSESQILFEHYCDEINQDPNGPSNFKWEYYECPNGCKDGACV